MTDDTDDADREEAESARSLPLIDTFAALQAELDAKEQRIERLESELAQGYLDPDGGQQAAADAVEVDDSDATADTETEPRSHEDWEPATDPLSDTGTASADGDHEGVTPSAEATKAKSDERTATSDPEPTDDSGLKPVRTASAGKATGDDAPTAESTTEESTGEEFGVTMEASTDLTGGSLGSSTDETFVAKTGEADDESDGSEDETPRPDPTADRGERLSLLVRRAELHDVDEVVETFARGIDALDDVTREMLAHYREAGDAAPVDAHVAAGGSGERRYAYARNRTLRKAGVIEHDSAGRYRYALPDLVEEAFDGNVDGQTLADAVAGIEAETGLRK